MKKRAPSFGLVVLVSALLSIGCHREPDYDGHPLEYWFGALSDADAVTRAQAADIVAREAPQHPETVSRLLAALRSESDTTVHAVLVRALGDAVSTSGGSPGVVGSLIELMRDEHQSVRNSAAMALARIEATASDGLSPDSPIVAGYAAMLRSPDEHSRAAAADAMGIIVAERPTTSGLFANQLADVARTDKILLVKLSALRAFSQIRTADSVAIAVYASAFGDGFPEMATIALRTLANIPSVAAALSDSSTRLLGSDDLMTRILAVRALEAAARANSAPKILEALQRATADRDSLVQETARAALKGVRPKR